MLGLARDIWVSIGIPLSRPIVARQSVISVSYDATSPVLAQEARDEHVVLSICDYSSTQPTTQQISTTGQAGCSS